MSSTTTTIVLRPAGAAARGASAVAVGPTPVATSATPRASASRTRRARRVFMVGSRPGERRGRRARPDDFLPRRRVHAVVTGAPPRALLPAAPWCHADHPGLRVLLPGRRRDDD